jgi:dihydroflavonol-4-reductase
MKTLVTGATGHLGGNLVRALLDEGRDVRALVRDDVRTLEGLDVERVRGDILEPSSLAPAMEGAEVVYHLAGAISVAGDPGGVMHRTNVEGTANVVAACLEAGVRKLVHFSSIHAFSAHPADQVIDETRAPAGGKHAIAYDRTKAAGDAEVQAGVARGLDAVIVNPGAVIGPWDYKPSPMGEVVLDWCHRRMPALLAAGFNWVDARDVVAGAMAAEKRGRTGERYLLTGDWQTVVELATLVEEFSGVKRPGFVSPMWLAMIGAPFVTAVSRLTGKRPRYTLESLKVLRGHRHVSHQKATDELGYATRPLTDTIRDTVAWFRDNGMIEGSGVQV